MAPSILFVIPAQEYLITYADRVGTFGPLPYLSKPGAVMLAWTIIRLFIGLSDCSIPPFNGHNWQVQCNFIDHIIGQLWPIINQFASCLHLNIFVMQSEFLCTCIQCVVCQVSQTSCFRCSFHIIKGIFCQLPIFRNYFWLAIHKPILNKLTCLQNAKHKLFIELCLKTYVTLKKTIELDLWFTELDLKLYY